MPFLKKINCSLKHTPCVSNYKIINYKLRITNEKVWALPMNSNHFRRKYLNLSFVICNCEFGLLPDKLQIIFPLHRYLFYDIMRK